MTTCHILFAIPEHHISITLIYYCTFAAFISVHFLPIASAYFHQILMAENLISNILCVADL